MYWRPNSYFKVLFYTAELWTAIFINNWNIILWLLEASFIQIIIKAYKMVLLWGTRTNWNTASSIVSHFKNCLVKSAFWYNFYWRAFSQLLICSYSNQKIFNSLECLMNLPKYNSTISGEMRFIKLTQVQYLMENSFFSMIQLHKLNKTISEIKMSWKKRNIFI